jgi:hexokinase
VDASPELTTTDRILREKLSIAHSTVQDRRIVKKVCTLVSRRAARLSAVGIAGCVTQMGNSGHVSAGIDGSVFKKHPLVRGVSRR